MIRVYFHVVSVNRSLPYEREITKYLESDRFINAVLDNKTLDMGNQSRFKTEIVLDAQLITRHFLDTEVDLDAMLVVSTPQQIS